MQQARNLSNKDLCFRLAGIAAFHVDDADAQMAVYEAIRRLQISNDPPKKLWAETTKVRCCSAASPCDHQKRWPGTVCETCHDAATDQKK